MGSDYRNGDKIDYQDIKFWAVWGSILSTETPGRNTPEIHRTVARFRGEECWRKVIATKGESGNDFRSVKP